MKTTNSRWTFVMMLLVWPLLNPTVLSAKCNGGSGGGMLAQFDFDLVCNDQNSEMTFWLTEPAESGTYQVFLSDSYYIVNANDPIEFALALDSEVQLFVFDGNYRMRVFSPGPLQCETPILIGEFFTCDEAAGEIYYNWTYVDGLSQNSEQLYFDGSGLSNLLVYEGTSITVGYTDGTAVSMNLFAEADGDPLASFDYSVTPCCPCHWDTFYNVSWSPSCSNETSLSNLLDNFEDDIFDLQFYAHSDNESHLAGETFAPSPESINNQLLDENQVTIQYGNPSNQCFALSGLNVSPPDNVGNCECGLTPGEPCTTDTGEEGTYNSNCDCAENYLVNHPPFGEGAEWTYSSAYGPESPLTYVVSYDRDTTILSLPCTVLRFPDGPEEAEVVFCTEGQQVKYLMNDSLFVLYDFSLNEGESYMLRLPTDLQIPYSIYENSTQNWESIGIDEVSTVEIDGVTLKTQSLILNNDFNELSCDFNWCNPIERIGAINFLFPNCSFHFIDGCCDVNLTAFKDSDIDANFYGYCDPSTVNPCPDPILLSVNIECNDDNETFDVILSASGGALETDNSLQYIVSGVLNSPQYLSLGETLVLTYPDDTAIAFSVSDGVGCLTEFPYSNLDYAEYVDCFTGIEELAELGILLHPNPIQDQVKIQAKEALALVVYQLNGKEIVNQRLEAGLVSLDLSSHPSGLYFFQFTTDSGSYTERVLKQ